MCIQHEKTAFSTKKLHSARKNCTLSTKKNCALSTKKLRFSTTKLLCAAKLLSSTAVRQLSSDASKVLEDDAAKTTEQCCGETGHSPVHETSNNQNISNCRTLFKKVSLSFLFTKTRYTWTTNRDEYWDTCRCNVLRQGAKKSGGIIKDIHVGERC